MLSVGTPNEKLHRKSLVRQSRSLTRVSGGNGQSGKREGRSPLAAVASLAEPSSSNSCQSIGGALVRNLSSGNVLAKHAQLGLSAYDLFSVLSRSALNLRWNAEQERKPAPLVIAGPSGSGKSTLLKLLMNEFQDCFGFSISHTTRKPRPGEQHGREYYFVDQQEFETSIANDEFIEFTRFANNYYGTSKKAVQEVQNSGKICVLDVEMEGVKNLKKTDLSPRFVFIKPPNMEILEQRLRSRGTETEESLQRRLERAIEELRFGEVEGFFDLMITNDNVQAAYKMLRDFIVEDIEALKRTRGM